MNNDDFNKANGIGDIGGSNGNDENRTDVSNVICKIPMMPIIIMI